MIRHQAEGLAGRLFDGIEQHLCRERLTQKRHPSCRNRLAPDYLIIEASHEYDWVREAVRGQLMRQFHAGYVAKLDVNDEASRLACRSAGEKCLR